jgi:hypothetical protein
LKACLFWSISRSLEISLRLKFLKPSEYRQPDNLPGIEVVSKLSIRFKF